MSAPDASGELAELRRELEGLRAVLQANATAAPAKRERGPSSGSGREVDQPKPPRREPLAPQPGPPPRPRLHAIAAARYAILNDNPSREEVHAAAMDVLMRYGLEAKEAGGPAPARQLREELRTTLQLVEVRLSSAVPGYAEDAMVSRCSAAKAVVDTALDRAETLAKDGASLITFYGAVVGAKFVDQLEPSLPGLLAADPAANSAFAAHMYSARHVAASAAGVSKDLLLQYVFPVFASGAALAARLEAACAAAARASEAAGAQWGAPGGPPPVWAPGAPSATSASPAASWPFGPGPPPYAAPAPHWGASPMPWPPPDTTYGGPAPQRGPVHAPAQPRYEGRGQQVPAPAQAPPRYEGRGQQPPAPPDRRQPAGKPADRAETVLEAAPEEQEAGLRTIHYDEVMRAGRLRGYCVNALGGRPCGRLPCDKAHASRKQWVDAIVAARRAEGRH